nr:hypothetical protein [Tanacetum cinerariifolium]
VHRGRYKVPTESIRDVGFCKKVRRHLLPTFLSVSANASELPTSTEPHIEPVDTNENCNPPNRHCIPILTVFERFRNLPTANVESDSMSRLGVGKRFMSDMVSPCMPADRFESSSAVAKSISIKRNAMIYVAPSEEHAAEVSLRFRNACGDDFWSFEFGTPKSGDNHGVQYLTLTYNILLYVISWIPIGIVVAVLKLVPFRFALFVKSRGTIDLCSLIIFMGESLRFSRFVMFLLEFRCPMRELVVKYKAEKVCHEKMVKMPLVDLKLLEDGSFRICMDYRKLSLHEVQGGARVAFKDEFGAAEEREVLCEAQQGRSGVKMKLFGSLRNKIGCVHRRREKVIAYTMQQLQIHVENDTTHVMDLGGNGYSLKDKNQAKTDKTEHGMERE